MEQEYRVGLFWKIFYGLTVGGLLIVFSLLVIATLPEKPVYLIFLAPILLFLVVLINIFKSKVIITDSDITRKRIFYNKTLNFANIKGVRIESKIIVIEPLDVSCPKIKISNYDSFGKSEELAKWLSERFVDLDNVDRQTEEEALLNDNSLGFTREEREAKISKMKQVAMAYNIWGGVVPFMLLFTSYNNWIFFMGSLYPLLGLVLMKFSGDLIKFITNPKRSVYPGIIIGFIIPIIILLVVALKAYEILFFADVLKGAAVIGLTLFLLLFFLGKNENTEAVKGQVFLMGGLAVIYGLGVTILANCLFDNSKPVKFQTQVVDEYISSGKGAHYHLKLKPWLPGQNIREVDVSEKSYYKTLVGSTVFIYQKKGLLNIPWFDFELDPTPPVPAGSNNGNSPAPR
ncbi:MAG: hypothetical protein V4456_12285 [Bacteroidota bacterium]